MLWRIIFHFSYLFTSTWIPRSTRRFFTSTLTWSFIDFCWVSNIVWWKWLISVTITLCIMQIVLIEHKFTHRNRYYALEARIACVTWYPKLSLHVPSNGVRLRVRSIRGSSSSSSSWSFVPDGFEPLTLFSEWTLSSESVTLTLSWEPPTFAFLCAASRWILTWLKFYFGALMLVLSSFRFFPLLWT